MSLMLEESNFVNVYIEDAIGQLLEHKDDNPKINPTRFFGEYFSSVRDGNHVLFREYTYVKATPHNRSSFVRTFWKCFRHIGRKGDLLSMKEYHSLICILCPDFPFHPVQKTARIILMDDAMDCLISFTDFLFAFQLQFCFDEFLIRCAEVYKNLLSSARSTHEPVVVPTSDDTRSTSGATESSAGTMGDTSQDGVDSAQFLRSLIPIAENMDPGAPSPVVLKDILGDVERVTFYGFLIALSKSEHLNKFIGKLPRKSSLLDASDQELTSPAVRPTSATQNTQPKRTKKHNPLPPTPPMLNPATVASTIGNITDTKGVPSHARSQPIAVMSLSNILKKVSGNVSSVDHDQKKKSVSTQDSDTETDENSDNYVSEQSDSGSGSTTN